MKRRIKTTLAFVLAVLLVFCNLGILSQATSDNTYEMEEGRLGFISKGMDGDILTLSIVSTAVGMTSLDLQFVYDSDSLQYISSEPAEEVYELEMDNVYFYQNINENEAGEMFFAAFFEVPSFQTSTVFVMRDLHFAVINRENEDAEVGITDLRVSFENDGSEKHAEADVPIQISLSDGHIHRWNEGSIIKEATCSENGVKEFTCSECGGTKKQKLKCYAHTDADNDWVCDVCLNPIELESNAITMVSKGYKNGFLTVAVVSTALGFSSVGGRIICDANVLRYVNRLTTPDGREAAAMENELVFYADVVNDSDPSIIGYAAYFFETQPKTPFELSYLRFSIIDHSVFDSEIAIIVDQSVNEIKTLPPVLFKIGEPHEHLWDEGKITVSPTYTVLGERIFSCTICGETRTEEIPKLIPPVINISSAREADGYVFAGLNLTGAELLNAAGEGATIIKNNGLQLGENENVASGMILKKPDGAIVLIIIKGDNDGDGAVTAADARYALRIAVSLEKPNAWQLEASLVTGGKTVTAADARSILRTAVGLEKLTLI